MPARRANGAGSVSLEFALVLPLLIVLLIGVAEATQLLRAKMKLNHAAGALAKMVAQKASPISSGAAGTLGGLCAGAELALAPYGRTTFAAAIASVTTSNADGGTTTSRDWESDASCSAAAASLGAAKAVGLATAAGVVPNAGDSVVIVSASYTYGAYTSLLLAASATLTQVVYARPRANKTIACSTC